MGLNRRNGDPYSVGREACHPEKRGTEGGGRVWEERRRSRVTVVVKGSRIEGGGKGRSILLLPSTRGMLVRPRGLKRGWANERAFYGEIYRQILHQGGRSETGVRTSSPVG